MKHDTEKYRNVFEKMSSEKIEEINRLNDEEHQRQAQAFKVGYKRIFAIYVISPSKLSAKMIHVYIGYYDNASLRKRLPKNLRKIRLWEYRCIY
ncbi:hypothetical protein PKHYL_20030 [Psychrobacter sp. KH172YL61]|uniref:hypothetical protein n=1 Tax=Psychrobacter sp. KH172YL61 TaxID=2517899 RepID=UPI0010BBD394|nr:hypothetical protein [Psychrobacter sp. KH172YL61]BBI67812.1 hypothetical protein PKHYL_20030 [Psychrobacter sp. KH172YL61]